MNKIFSILILITILTISPQAAFSNEVDENVDLNEGHDVPLEDNCDNLHRKLRSCEEYRCASVAKNGVVRGVYIRPYDSYLKTCTHLQSTDSDDIITCKYDDTTRKFVANMFQKQQQGYELSEDEQKLMDGVFRNHCTVGVFDFKHEANISNNKPE
jgi:hypothetical protein